MYIYTYIYSIPKSILSNNIRAYVSFVTKLCFFILFRKIAHVSKLKFRKKPSRLGIITAFS